MRVPDGRHDEQLGLLQLGEAANGPITSLIVVEKRTKRLQLHSGASEDIVDNARTSRNLGSEGDLQQVGPGHAAEHFVHALLVVDGPEVCCARVLESRPRQLYA